MISYKSQWILHLWNTTGRIEKMKEEGIMMGDVSLTVEVEDK